jgi:hypothetical protein
MKWIDEVKAHSLIAEVPAKANEQHYEVTIDNALVGASEGLASPGFNKIHAVNSGSACQVLCLSIPYRNGDFGSSRRIYARKLL